MTAPSASPVLLAVGARSPLGPISLQTAMCARAGKAEPRGTPFFDKRQQRVGMIRARFLPDDLVGYERLCALAAPALAEAGRGLAAPIPLFVGLPEAIRPDDDPRYDESFIGELARRSNVPIDRDASQVVRAGHASFALALEAAVAAVEHGPAAAIVGAVDSYFHPDAVAWLDASCRLHAPQTEDGIIPSEGAAFVVLAHGGDGESGRKALASLYAEPPTPMARLRHVCTGRDASMLDPDAPLGAEVMTDLVQRAVAALGGDVRWVLSDLNGELHRLREWSRVEIRCENAFDDSRHDRLPDQLGDLGAATGAVALALASTLWKSSCAPASTMLCALHSELDERGAFVAESMPPELDGGSRPVSAAGGASTSKRERKARDAARDVCTMLENLLLALGRAADELDTAAATESVKEALAMMARLEQAPIDAHRYFELLDAARDHVEQLATSLARAGDDDETATLARTGASVVKQLRRCRERSVDVVVERQELMRGTAAAAGDLDGSVRPFLGSVGVPRLHRLPRPTLQPAIEPHRLSVEQRLEIARGAVRRAESRHQRAMAARGEGGPARGGMSDMAAFAEGLATEPSDEQEAEPSPPATGAAEPLDEYAQEHLQWTARDCLSEIAALSNLRVPLDQAPWSFAERFEDRLLATLDALIALGMPTVVGASAGWDVLARVQRYGWDTYVPDFGRQFTRALALCCVEGGDTVRAVLMALRQANPMTHGAIRDALALSPNPTIASEIADTLREGDPAIMPTLLEVLRFRREATLSSLVLLSAHPDPKVAAAVARTLGYVAPKAGAVEALHTLERQQLDDGVDIAVATSLVMHGDDAALARARDLLAEPEALSDATRLSCLRLLALAGRAQDVQVVEAALDFSPQDAEICGWFGHAGLVDWLLAALEGAGELRGSKRWPLPIELALVGALVRITGADLRDEPIANVEYDFEHQPALQAQTWIEWWEERAGDWPLHQRYRFGKPYHPAATVEELLAPQTPARARDTAALELHLMTGPGRFEPRDWVARQRLTLDEARLQLEQDDFTYPEGAWLADELRHRAER